MGGVELEGAAARLACPALLEVVQHSYFTVYNN